MKDLVSSWDYLAGFLTGFGYGGGLTLFFGVAVHRCLVRRLQPKAQTVVLEPDEPEGGSA